MPKLYAIQTSPKNAAFARVVFEKQSDRWTHRIEWVTPAGTVLVASSIEGTPDDVWPPSQPLQEISHADLDGRPVLLGVGLAGRSHWSISCSLEPESGEHAGSIFFDLACLVKAAPSRWLGSSYLLGPAATCGDFSEDGMRLKIGSDHEILISARGDTGNAGDWGTRIQFADDRLQMIPAVMSTNPKIASRWAFAVEVAAKPSQPD